MPAKSKAQLKYIFTLRGKYETEENTPEEDKWIWDSKWEDVKWEDLPDKVEETVFESFSSYILEFVTQKDLEDVEQAADKYFNKIGLDVEFTRHFLDRVNDRRNRKQITADELHDIFKDAYLKYGLKLRGREDDYEAVFKDMTSDINAPFVLNHNERTGEVELIMKTIMRKPNFRTPNDIYKLKT